MNNEELAALIQAGERDKLPELWEQVRRFAWKQGCRWLRALDGRGGVTLEDLLQCSFLALMAAVDSFDPERFKAFVGWYALHLKTAFSEACCIRTQLQRQDPIHHAASLDTPLTDDESDPLTLEGTIPDTAAEAAFEEVEDRQRREAIEKALQSLTEDQRAVIRLRYWNGLTRDQAASAMGRSQREVTQLKQKAFRALRHPSVSRELMRYR